MGRRVGWGSALARNFKAPLKGSIMVPLRVLIRDLYLELYFQNSFAIGSIGSGKPNPTESKYTNYHYGIRSQKTILGLVFCNWDLIP